MEPSRTKVAQVTDKGRSVLAVPRVQTFIERIVDGDKWKDAAQAAGLRIRRAKTLLDSTVIRREISRQLEVLRESNRGRNILLRETLRDRGFKDDATAAEAKVALEAARQLDGEENRGGITITGGQNVIAGYVIKLPPPGDGPRAITNRSASGANPLIEHDDVTDDER